METAQCPCGNIIGQPPGSFVLATVLHSTVNIQPAAHRASGRTGVTMGKAVAVIKKEICVCVCACVPSSSMHVHVADLCPRDPCIAHKERVVFSLYCVLFTVLVSFDR